MNELGLQQTGAELIQVDRGLAADSCSREASPAASGTEAPFMTPNSMKDSVPALAGSRCVLNGELCEYMSGEHICMSQLPVCRTLCCSVAPCAATWILKVCGQTTSCGKPCKLSSCMMQLSR